MRPRLRVLAFLLFASHLSLADETDSPPPPDLPAVVDRLEVEGLWRTKPHVVDRELPWKPGDVVTAEDWELGLLRLSNLGIFSRVDGRIEEREDGRVAVLDLEERWTIMLMLQGGLGGGSYWFRTGLYDINTLGRYVETGALYERFDIYNGFQVWTRMPRFLDERQELYIAADRLVRPRPGFSLVRTGLHTEYSRELTETLTLGGKLEGVMDRFVNPLIGDPAFPADSESIIAGAWLRVGRVDVRRLLHTGWHVDVKPSVGFTNAPGKLAFGQLFVESLLFKIVNPWLVLGARIQAGATTETQEQHRFYLGGLDTMRGYPDNHVRTDRYAFTNLEARFVAFDSTYLALMPTLFVDAAVAHDDRNGNLGLVSAGPGIRILVPRLYRSGIRLDLPFPLTPAGKPSVSFGVYQFFGR